MDNLTKLEKSLQQLIPSAVSDEAQTAWNDEIAMKLDELEAKGAFAAKGAFTNKAEPSKRFGLSRLITAAAACLVMGFGTAAMYFKNNQSTELILTETPKKRSLYQVLSSTKWVESQKDEGLVQGTVGDKQHRIPMRQVRYKYVAEERLRDPETGDVVRLREPSEKVVLEPVAGF